ncbi:FAD-binding protein, partial [Burkholderia multivorans]|nr:FAD-binding protein [Burkholderia multivorans]
MAAPLEHVLVIGGGFSGMATAIQCAKLGLAVDLVEIDPGWR